MLDVRTDRTGHAYLDFVVGLKRYNLGVLAPALCRFFERKETEFVAQKGRAPETIADVAEMLEPSSIYRFERFLTRFAQEKMWQEITAVLEPQAAALRERLNRARPDPIGRLELNPDLDLPEWYSRFDVHLQPGSYHSDDLCAFAYALGSILFLPTRDTFQESRRLAARIPQRPYRRILDMGTSVGRVAIALSERFPEAEVTAIDLAAPLLKYGHHMAESLGRRIVFSQQNAERLAYPDVYFDLATARILFHEVHPRALVNIVREVYRVLAPGGRFYNLDLPPYRVLHPYTQFIQEWETEGNGEPYWSEYRRLDLPALLHEVGFVSVSEGPLTDEPDPPKRWPPGRYPLWLTWAEKEKFGVQPSGCS